MRGVCWYDKYLPERGEDRRNEIESKMSLCQVYEQRGDLIGQISHTHIIRPQPQAIVACFRKLTYVHMRICG